MSTESKYTPGPWWADQESAEENGVAFVIRNRRNNTDWGVAGIWHQSGGELRGGEDEANARLIAAAPELVEALLVLADIIPDLDAVRAEEDPREVSALNLELVRAVNSARTALKKAGVL